MKTITLKSDKVHAFRYLVVMTEYLIYDWALASRHIREETETKSVKGVRWQSFRTINLALPGPAGVDITGMCLLALENLLI